MLITSKPDIFDPAIKPYFTRNGRNGRKDYGGYSPCTTGKIECFEGSTLNNCVGGAWGLFAMAEQNPDCKIGFIKSGVYPQDAGSWYNDGKGSKWDTYERGQEPKLGSVICYSGNGSGHVAYVIGIDGDTLTLLSSGYGNTTQSGFDIRKVRKSNNYDWPTMKGYHFQGFIYPKLVEHIPDKPTVTEITTEQAVHKMAEDVIRGLYGNGFLRKEKLYSAIQGEVNKILRG